jgi:NADPH:quinone reductase-like Zn-dependent oxidoreductase
MSGGQFTIAPSDLIFRDIRVRGFWQKYWLDTTSRDEVAASYGRLAALVTDGYLRAPVAATYSLDQFSEALAHATRPDRVGKVLFTW